jgi:hypothetical protein
VLDRDLPFLYPIHRHRQPGLVSYCRDLRIALGIFITQCAECAPAPFNFDDSSERDQTTMANRTSSKLSRSTIGRFTGLMNKPGRISGALETTERGDCSPDNVRERVLSVNIIKEAVLRRLDSLDDGQLRDRLEAFVAHSPRDCFQSRLYPQLPASPYWVRTISVALYRLPLLHSFAKNAYRKMSMHVQNSGTAPRQVDEPRTVQAAGEKVATVALDKLNPGHTSRTGSMS